MSAARTNLVVTSLLFCCHPVFAQSQSGQVSRFDVEQHSDGKLLFRSTYLFAPQGVVFGLATYPSEFTSYGLYGMTAKGDVRVQWFTLRGTAEMSEPGGSEVIHLAPDSDVPFQIVDHSDKEQIQSVTSAQAKSVSQDEHDVWHKNANVFLRKLRNDKAVAREFYDVDIDYVKLIHKRKWTPSSTFAIRLGVAPRR